MVIIVLFALFFLRVPIAFTIMASSILFLAAAGVPLGVQIQRMVAIADNFPLLAVPLFILAGEFMNAAGMTARLFAFANALVGHIRGGLAQVNIATSMLMAGMSGSAIADCAATTKVFVPVMVKSGYSKAFATAVTAASATIGPIIPPSIIFVVYGWLAGVSIGKLFLAGAVPGLLMGLYLMITVFFLAKKKNFGKSGESFSLHTLKRTTRDALLAMFMPLIILGGILGGVFTATEAAGVAVVYSFGVGTLIYRRISLSDLPGILRATAVDTAAVMFIVAAAGPFGWILGLQQVPQILIQLFSSISNNPWVILLILNAGFLIIGCFMETTAIMLITVPLLMPLIHKVGIDPVHFGVVISVNLLIGTLTPPVGVLMFTTCGIAQIPVEDFITEVWPFYIALLFLLFTITYFPAVVLWLPKAVLG